MFELVQLSHGSDVFRAEAEKIEIKELWIIGQNLKHCFAAMSFAHLPRKPGCGVALGCGRSLAGIHLAKPEHPH